MHSRVRAQTHTHTHNTHTHGCRSIYELKERFKYRLCVEETLSFGVLGARGRGACEAAGLKPGQVEIICASMSGALGSVGGFCVGHSEASWGASGSWGLGGACAPGVDLLPAAPGAWRAFEHANDCINDYSDLAQTG